MIMCGLYNVISSEFWWSTNNAMQYLRFTDKVYRWWSCFDLAEIALVEDFLEFEGSAEYVYQKDRYVHTVTR